MIRNLEFRAREYLVGAKFPTFADFRLEFIIIGKDPWSAG